MDRADPREVETARRAAEEAGGVAVPVVRGRWTGRSLRIELEPAFGAGRTVGETELLAGRMRDAVLGSVERATTVTVVSRLPLPRRPR
jgi:hypothetical protein